MRSGTQSPPRCILVIQRRIVPELAADERREEAAGVSRADGLGVLGGGEEPKPIAFGTVDQTGVHALSKKFEEPARLSEVFGHDMPERGVPSPALLCESTSRPVLGFLVLIKSRREFLVFIRGC